MKKYVVYVQSLHRSLSRHELRREVVFASSSAEACRVAVARNRDLGVTPPSVSMFWPDWPEVLR